MKKKNVIFYAFVGLIIGFLIFAVIFTPIYANMPAPDGSGSVIPDDSGNKNPDGSDDPNGKGPDDTDDPNKPVPPPPHEHRWLWSSTEEEHWQYCPDDGEIQNKGKHVYDGTDSTMCNVCDYVRKLPTEQGMLDIEFTSDGKASIVGTADGAVINDLVIPSKVTGPDGSEIAVEEISEGAFQLNDDLNSLTIQDGLSTIGANAFSTCNSLKTVIIPQSVTYIDPSAFQSCLNLTQIVVDVSNSVYMSAENCIIDIAERTIIIGCTGSTITNRTNGSKQFVATSIGANAFYGSGITQIDIPDNIEYIGTNAFHACSFLSAVTGLEGVTAISASLFSGCEALKTVELPDGLTEIGQNAFDDCSALESVTIPASVAYIRDYAFDGCTALESVTLNEGLITISNAAFRGCTSLESITLPSTIKAILNNAFQGCTALTEIIYNGSASDWAEKVTILGTNWNNGVEVTFAKTEESDPGEENNGGESGGSDNTQEPESSDGDGTDD